jgi:hypothetical protein
MLSKPSAFTCFCSSISGSILGSSIFGSLFPLRGAPIAVQDRWKIFEKKKLPNFAAQQEQELEKDIYHKKAI